MFYWGYLWNMGEGLFTGAEMTQDSCIIKVHPNWVAAYKSWVTWSTLHSSHTAQQTGKSPFHVTQWV